MMAALPMPAPPPFSVDGVPLRLVAADAIRQARAALDARRRFALALDAPTLLPIEPVAVAPLPPCPRLARITRAFLLAELRTDALRVAAEAADMRDHIEGLAAGRSYGDPDLYGLTPADFAARFLPEARARAERAGAIADLLLALIGREVALETVLTEGAGV